MITVERVPQVNERPDQPPDTARLRPNEVEVRMLASRERVPGVRALAADMAMREDFDLDAIADLRLAVEEACATVLAVAEPESTLVFRMLVSANLLEINARAAVRPGAEPAVGTMSLRILSTLADSVDYWTSGDDVSGGQLFHVRLTKAQPSI
jgi:serine/threonine-protein kinase RsbW